jgi:hypothetical protein
MIGEPISLACARKLESTRKPDATATTESHEKQPSKYPARHGASQFREVC